MAACEFTITHPTNEEVAKADFDLDGTPLEFVTQLVAQGWLKECGNGKSYAVIVAQGGKEGRALNDKDSFAKQGVASGESLAFQVRSVGAAPRRTGPAVDRLKLDYRSLKDLEGRGCFGAVIPYADRGLAHAITSEADAGQMRRYVAELSIRLPVAPDRFADRWEVLVDLEPSWSNYPSASYRPSVQFLGAKPWHYRVSKAGGLCTVEVGSAAYVAGQHLGGIARLINGDEPFEKAHDHGYDHFAYDYYRANFNGPVNPDLEIPSVRESVFIDSDDPGDKTPIASGPVVLALNLRRPESEGYSKLTLRRG